MENDIKLVQLIIIQNNQILLSLRKNTGYCDGEWCLPGGHVESNESLLNAVIRETFEELNLNLSSYPHYLDLFKVIERFYKEQVNHYTDFIFKINPKYITPNIRNIVENKEPDKCEKLKWFNLDNLPNNMIEYQKDIFNNNCNYIKLHNLPD